MVRLSPAFTRKGSLHSDIDDIVCHSVPLTITVPPLPPYVAVELHTNFSLSDNCMASPPSSKWPPITASQHYVSWVDSGTSPNTSLLALIIHPSSRIVKLSLFKTDTGESSINPCLQPPVTDKSVEDASEPIFPGRYSTS